MPNELIILYYNDFETPICAKIEEVRPWLLGIIVRMKWK